MANGNADANDIDRSPAIGVLNFGKSYVDAAEIILRQIESGNEHLSFDDPILFLLGHGLELTFKAFLRAKGISAGRLKGFGHDLVRLLETVRQHGLEVAVDETTMQHLKLLGLHFGPPYEIRYFQIGYKVWPNPQLLLIFAQQLYRQLLPICLAA